MDVQLYLPRNLRHSRLQKKILIYLSRKPEKSITAIAKSIGCSRESTSRSLHKLKNSGRIFRSVDGYRLTIWGKEESSKVEIVERAKDINVHWWDASVGFDCPCGNTDIVISDESDDKICDGCGRVYRFTSKLEIVIVSSGVDEAA